MFKKTRKKIVTAIMSILVILFVGVLAGIYGASYAETSKINLEMLKAHAQFLILSETAPYPNAQTAGEAAPGMPDLNAPGADDPAPDEFDRERNELPAGNPSRDNDFRRKFQNRPEYKLSSFYAVVVTKDSMKVVENSNAVFTDEELLQIAETVYRKNRSDGTVNNLSYYKEKTENATLLVFKDNSIMDSSITTLFKYTLIFGAIALVLFFFLSRQLAKMIVQPLEESHTRQKQFISDAGHELKTPVSVIDANAELLTREIGENPWLANIRYENERMGALVTQLLDLARTENVTPQMENVDLSRLVTGEALPFESVVFEQGMILKCEISENIHVLGNSTQLKQLTAILLDNAVHHADEKSEIFLKLKREHNFALLSVTNDGQEIPAEVRKFLFDRFYRMDTARNGEDKHYGLGLAIAKAITDIHHGKIEVHCANGKVEFMVHIPLKKQCMNHGKQKTY